MVIKYKEVNPLNCLISEDLKYLPNFDSIFWGRIPSKTLTQLRFFARMGSYNRILFHPTRIIFRQTFPPCLRLTNKLKIQAIFLFFRKFIMYQFNLKGDMGRHHLSISGAYTECGISTSTINRSEGKTFPPKVKLSEGRVGFRIYQIEEWLNGKRGEWK